jgi:uncharacterized tellurite resistance protein B-like protein
MLRAFTDLLHSLRYATTTPDAPTRQHALQLATAVLLVEVVRADGHIDAAEREAVITALRQRFELSAAELTTLFEQARDKADHTHDLYSFTSELNQSLDETERVRVFQQLWDVAHSDGRADGHEQHLLRRLADLLHIRYADAIGAKLRAESAAARDKPGSP